MEISDDQVETKNTNPLTTNEFSRQLINNMLNGFVLFKVIKDENDNITDVEFVDINNTVKNYVGVPREKIIGMRISAFSKNDNKKLQFLKLIYRKQRPVELDFFDKNLNKHFQAYFYFPDKKHIAVFLNDISEKIETLNRLKFNDAKLRSFIDSSFDGIVIAKDDGNIVEWNKALENITGLTKEEAKQQSAWTLQSMFLKYKSFDSNILKSKYKNLKDESHGLFDSVKKYSIKLKNNEHKHVDIASFKFSADNNTYYASVLRDVSKSHKMELQLKKSEKKLQESVNMKDKLISIIGHDLKNPLHLISNYTELITDKYNGNLPSELQDLLNVLKIQSKQTTKLLQTLLDWTKAKNESIEFLPRRIYLNQLVLENKLILLEGYKNKNIDLQTNVSNSIFVQADYDMLNTIIRNLLSNALKFTKPGGKVIINSKKRREFVAISIEDNGVGIKPEHIDALFNIEKRFYTKGTNNEQGSGLGLILCKEFIDKHGGEICVESVLGKGTIFTFTVPESQIQ